MVIETYNIPLQMTEDYSEHWRKLLVSARDAFNFCVELLLSEKSSLTMKCVHRTCYNKTREKFKMLTSQMVIKCEQAASSAIKSTRSNKHYNAVPKKKSLVMTLDKRLYGVLTVNGITLTGPTAHKRSLVPFALFKKAEHMLTQFKSCDPTIFLKDDKFYLSVPFEVPEKPVTNDNACGVDLGMRQFFVTSEGKSFRDTTYLGNRRKVRHLKSELQRKKTKSAHRHRKKLRKKEHNLSKDMCYRAAHMLINSTNAGVIVLEDLTKIKKNTSKTKEGYKRKRHNNAMSQVPFYMFRKIVEHKAQLAGKQVETVSPTYTSQTDSRTGKKDGQRCGRRYVCSDGVVLDADWNAAINIGVRSKHPVSSRPPIDGGLTPLTGRVQSTTQSYASPH